MAPVGRRMRENAATASDRRVIAAFEARDLDALADAFADDYAESIVSAAPAMITRSEMLAGLRTLFELPGASLQIEPLATLGESLELHRTKISAAGGPIVDYVSVVEVDFEGRLVRTEAFDVERLDDAIVRLYEHYAASSPEARSLYALTEAEATEIRIDDVLALEPDAWLVRGTVVSSEREGGTVERPHLRLGVLRDGRVTGVERFEPGDEARALARFAELHS
jgi:hypothetical protein